MQINADIIISEDTVIDDDFLDFIHVGKISTEEELNEIPAYHNISSHPNYITDFNLWNQSLSIDIMKNWTSCK